MFSGLRYWRRRPEPLEARAAVRAAAEERSRLEPLNRFLQEQLNDNHFADRLTMAFLESLKVDHQ